MSATQGRLVEWLRLHRGFHSFASMESSLSVSVKNNAQLIQSLENNPKVLIEGDQLRYKPLYDQITCQTELLDYLRDNREGISIADAWDAYDSIERDVKVYIFMVFL